MAVTDLKLRGLKAPEKPTRIADRDGLYLLHKPNGSLLWRYDFAFAGKRNTLSIGKWPSVSVSQARRARDDARDALDNGHDPRRRLGSQKRSHETTFREVAERWYEMWEPQWRSARHRRKVRSALDVDLLPELGDMPIASIEASDLLKAIRKMEKRGVRELAHATRAYAGRIFRLAIAEGLAARDPSSDIRDALLPKPAVRNQAKMGETDLPHFLRGLEEDHLDEITRDALLLTLLTASRSGEIRFAEIREFEGIDSPEPLWRIPAERMKMERDHLVPLSTQAAEIVRRRLTSASNGLLFAADTRSGVISENTMLFGLYRLGYHSKATVHGLRGTFSTIANEHQWNSDWIEMCLAHTQGGVRAAYNAARYLKGRRELLQWWADYLDAARVKGAPRTT